jgi:hypothetical protein
VIDDTPRNLTGAYERAGRQAAVALRGYCTVVVISEDPLAAANVAIGVARVEAVHRRVVIGDLVGDLPPIQALVGIDDPHGIYDSFVFGTSLEKVIYHVRGHDNLNVLPGGTESPAKAEILSSRHWRRIASDFSATDSLLLLVTGDDAPSLENLSRQLDGVLLVGNPVLGTHSDAVLLARVPHPTVAPASATTGALLATDSEEPFWRRHARLLAIGTLVILFGIMFALRLTRPERVAATLDTVMIPNSLAPDSVVRQTRRVFPANPADSAIAARFAVEILAANTAEGANFELQRHGAMMPAATISLVPIGDSETIWYTVHAGAFTDSSQAARLLALLRRRHVIPDSGGSVVKTPFALLVDSVPSEAAVLSRSRKKIQDYSARGLAVYSLIQRDGSARLYVGAFVRPEQSSLAASAARMAGLSPVLEYRTGTAQ